MSRIDAEYDDDHVCRPLADDESGWASNENCYCCGATIYVSQHYDWLKDDLVEVGPRLVLYAVSALLEGEI